MTHILFGEDFLKHVRRLPVSIQQKADDLFAVLSLDARDSRLHTKKLHAEGPLYSFRVTRDYRVTFYFINQNTIYVVDIGHRKDIYRRIS